MKPRSSWYIFTSVVRALFLREISMRISIGKSGLFWTFFEPFFQTFIFVWIHAALIVYGGAKVGYDIIVFMASGFLAFSMFRSILSKGTGSIEANRALFNYRQVKPIDTIIARSMVELFLTFIVWFLFMAIGILIRYETILPHDIVMFLLSLLWLWFFSLSWALLCAIGNTFFVSVGKFVGIASFILLFVSAVFYPIFSLPPAIRELLLYNPLVHFMEMVHASYVQGFDDRFADYNYMLIWTIVPLFLGLWLYERLEKRLVSG